MKKKIINIEIIFLNRYLHSSKPSTSFLSRPSPSPAGFLFFILLGILLCFSGYAVPDLSEVEGLLESDDYQVWLQDKPQFVYKAIKQTNHGTNDIGSMSFLSFEYEERTTIQVKPKQKVAVFEIRPYSSQIEGVLDPEKNTISFQVDKPQHVVVVVNHTYDPVLIISANPPHSPPSPEAVEYYFGPGVHSPGRIDLKSGDDVYLAEGAVVEGCFTMKGTAQTPIENITISGRGILSLGQWPHKEAFRVFSGDDTKNVLIEGITVCNAPGWIVSFWGEGANRNLTVRNVKMLGNFLYNTDGVQTGTEGLLVEDCFIQTNDDTFSLNGYCKDVEIRNNVLWNLYNGGVFMLGWATRPYEWENMNIHDNVIFRAGGCCDYDPKGPFSLKTYTRGTCRNITFSNIIIEDIAPYGNWVHFESKQIGTIEDITFDNIDVLNTWKTSGDILGHSEDCLIEDITFRDVRILGKTIESPEDGGLVLRNTSEVQFENTGKVCTLPVGQIKKAVVQVPAGGSSSSSSAVWSTGGVNVLQNPSFEEKLQPWNPWRQAGDSRIVLVEDPVSEGKAAIRVENLKNNGTGVFQDITELLRTHGPGVYTYSALVRAAGDPVHVHVCVMITDENGEQSHPAPGIVAISDQWTQTARSHNLAWGDLKKAVLCVETSYGDTGSFYLDQCALLR